MVPVFLFLVVVLFLCLLVGWFCFLLVWVKCWGVGFLGCCFKYGSHFFSHCFLLSGFGVVVVVCGVFFFFVSGSLINPCVGVFVPGIFYVFLFVGFILFIFCFFFFGGGFERCGGVFFVVVFVRVFWVGV